MAGYYILVLPDGHNYSETVHMDGKHSPARTSQKVECVTVDRNRALAVPNMRQASDAEVVYAGLQAIPDHDA